jgi:phosphatidylglycerophosphatase A
MIDKFNTVFVTVFGIGKIKFAPGSVASLLTTFVLFYSFHIVNFPKFIILISLLVIFFYSFYAVNSYIVKKDNKDPKEIVIDEVIGQSIPLYMYEISHSTTKDSQESFLFYIYIFMLFRFFDIKKPFPVSFFDKNYKNSFGVIFDDVVAGLYVILTLIIFMFLKSQIL